MDNAEADATRVLPVVRRRKLASIRYAHSGVGPALARPANGTVAPSVDGARVWPTERVGLTDRVRRAGNARLTERIRLAGRDRPPEIAHE